MHRDHNEDQYEIYSDTTELAENNEDLLNQYCWRLNQKVLKQDYSWTSQNKGNDYLGITQLKDGDDETEII